MMLILMSWSGRVSPSLHTGFGDSRQDMGLCLSTTGEDSHRTMVFLPLFSEQPVETHCQGLVEYGHTSLVPKGTRDDKLSH